MESWLNTFGNDLRPEILLFACEETVVGICLLVFRVENRGPFSVRRAYLNTAGEGEAHSACIEFNNLLCLGGWETSTATALAGYLDSRNWDEFAVDGISEGAPLRALLQAFSHHRGTLVSRPSPYVDLRQLRQTNRSYDSALGPKVRKHLRQAVRRYGELRIDPPPDLQGALHMLDELAELHQLSWTARGQPGSFASESFRRFHRQIVESTFGAGQVQLLRVSANDRTIGILYSFIERGTVYFYQSGLQYGSDRKLRPGFAALGCAIPYCLEKGLDEFNFLASEDDYKQWLSTGSDQLSWVVFQRQTLKLRLINLMGFLKRRAKPMVGVIEV